MDGWVTVKQAKSLLGISDTTCVLRLLRRANVDEQRHRENGHGHVKVWFRLDQVTPIAAERRRIERLKASGKRRCYRCGQWKKELAMRKGKNLCRDCDSQIQRRRWAKKKFAGMGTDRVAGEVSEYIAHPLPTDARRYRCMDVGYHHRPVPIGRTKREAYCVNCEAKRCIHYPRWTPKQVVRLGPRIGK